MSVQGAEIGSRVGESGALEVVSRGLQQELQVTVVTTAVALQKAVVAGMPHIEIQAHLDLTTLQKVGNSTRLLGRIPPSVKSIRVRCCKNGATA